MASKKSVLGFGQTRLVSLRSSRIGAYQLVVVYDFSWLMLII